jgi:protein PhnA
MNDRKRPRPRLRTRNVGTRSKPIRLVDGDHEISCKMDGISIGLKACFVKKVMA